MLLFTRLFYFALLLICFQLHAQAPAEQDYGFDTLSFEAIDSLHALFLERRDVVKGIALIKTARNRLRQAGREKDSTYVIYGNNLGVYYIYAGKLNLAERAFREALQFWKKNRGEDHPEYLQAESNLVAVFYYTEQYDKAIEGFKRSLARLESLQERSPDFHRRRIDLLSNLAVCYRRQLEYDKAEDLYLEAYRASETYLNIAYQIPSILELGNFYFNINEFSQAEQALEKAALLAEKQYGKKHILYARPTQQLAALYTRRHQYSKADSIYTLLAPLHAQLYASRPSKRLLFLINYSNILARVNKLNEAKENLQRALQILNEKALTETASRIDIFIALANIARKEKDVQKALDYCYQAQAIVQEHPKRKDFIIKEVQLLNLLASIHFQKQQLDSSLYYCSQALHKNHPAIPAGFEDWTRLNQFSPDFYAYNQLPYTLSYLLSSLEASYQSSQDSIAIRRFYETAKASLALLDKVQRKFGGEREKLDWLKRSNNILSHTLEAAQKLGVPAAEQLSLVDAYKGNLLLQSTQSAQAQHFSNLPDSLFQQEKELDKKEDELQAALLQVNDTEKEQALRSQLIETQQQMSDFLKMLQQKYPAYFKLRYSNPELKVSELQAQLEKGQALLEYLVADSSIYLLYADAQQVSTYVLPVSQSTLNERVKALHRDLSDYSRLQDDAAAARASYIDNAHWCYEQLLAPALEAQKDIHQLLIIPDGQLAHLPFEVFLMEQPREQQPYKDFAYLLKGYAVHYDYSAQLWKSSLEQKASNNNGELLALAADYQSTPLSDSLNRLPVDRRRRAVLSPLPAAQAEVQSLSKHYAGFFATDSSANEALFKAKAPDYGVIHLAMHGLLEQQRPILSSLAFTENGDSIENNFLHAYEISKMELNADLVVLSACETGFGKFEVGNGTASLARAFRYAGVPSMLVSLWQVSDASTADIMVYFYEELEAGRSAAVALQSAKLRYLEQAKGMMAHPAFWGPFIQMGPSKNIDLGSNSLSYTWLALGLLALVVLIIGIGIGLRRRAK